MKIKAVCEATGLTDRTIRYYIDERILTPQYTENYLGRKTFNFTEADVEILRSVATLRKFGFSIAEIREMFENPQIIKATLEDLVKRKEETLSKEQTLLFILQEVDITKITTASDLAHELSKPKLEAEIPKEDSRLRFRRFLFRFIKGTVIGIITWLPIVVVGLLLFLRFRHFAYPGVDLKILLQIFVIISPSVLVLIISKIRGGLWKKIVKGVLLALCVLSLLSPYTYILPIIAIRYSETTSIYNYGKLDSDCIANRVGIYRELFPTWPNYPENKKEEKDTYYYYRYLEGMDYTYDIYAQWPLDKGQFDAEVKRVSELFYRESEKYKDINGYSSYVLKEMQNGDYCCLVLSYRGTELFKPVTNSYEIDIFAYNEKERIVRYITCHSLENGVDQPYYLELDW